MTSAQWADELRRDGVPAVVDLYDAAKILRCSQSGVVKLRDRGELHAVHPAGSWRPILFARTELARYLAKAN